MGTIMVAEASDGGATLPKDIEDCSANTKAILETARPLLEELPQAYLEYDLGQEDLEDKCNTAIKVLNNFIEDIRNGLAELNASCGCGPLAGAIAAAKAKMLQKVIDDTDFGPVGEAATNIAT